MAAAVETYLKWPTRKKVIVWGAFCAAMVLLYYFLGFQPRMAELRLLEDDYDRLGKELHENQAIADNLPRVKEEVRRLDAKLAVALEKLPNSEEIPNLLRTISDLGREAGLDFLLFKPGSPVPKEFYAEVPIEIQVLGKYHEVAQFFDRVGRLPRIVTIQRLDLGGAKTAVNGLNLTASCKATTFKFLEPGEKPPAKGAADKKAPGKAPEKAPAGQGGAT